MNNLRIQYLRKKYWVADFLKGSCMWRQYNDVMRMMRASQSEEKLNGGGRNDYLNRMLLYAKQYVPYYKRMTGLDALADFPVMNKQKYLQDYASFCVEKKDIPFQKGELHVQKTSGSTGTPFAVPQDTRCRTRRIAIIKAENEKIGFHSFEPMMHLRAFAHYWTGMSDGIVYRKDLNIWYVDNANLNDERVRRIVDVINHNKIKVIRGYMTTLDTITSYMEMHGMDFAHHPMFISVGELLQEKLRHRVADYLHCGIISQYGNEENGIFGQSDINGSGRHINLNGAGCVVEILRLDRDEPAAKGELGRIVVTDFTNYAFPMIRYDIGDLAAPCEYHADGTLKSIDRLSGRITDMIYRTNGEPVDIYNSMPANIHNGSSVKQYQFVQTDSKEYVLRLSTTDNSLRTQETAFVEQFKQILGADATIKVEWLSEIPVLNSGKRKVIVNEWMRNKSESAVR